MNQSRHIHILVEILVVSLGVALWSTTNSEQYKFVFAFASIAAGLLMIIEIADAICTSINNLKK